jgi:hypothetical protein
MPHAKTLSALFEVQSVELSTGRTLKLGLTLMDGLNKNFTCTLKHISGKYKRIYLLAKGTIFQNHITVRTGL